MRIESVCPRYIPIILKGMQSVINQSLFYPIPSRPMSISKDEVKAWRDNALKKLEWARELSTLAQAVLESTSHVLGDLLPKRLQIAESNIDQVKDQHANITPLFEHLRVKIADATVSGFQSCVEKLLVPALDALAKVLGELRTTKVPPFLVAPEERKDYRHLSDFLALSEIELLQNNIAIYTENCTKVLLLLKDLLQDLTHKWHKNSSTYNKATRVYNSQVVDVQLMVRHALMPTSPPRHESNFVRAVLKENLALEQQLAGLLEMLTNHYDQCVLAVSTYDDSSQNQVNYEVLHNDTLELPSVLKEFSAIYDVIMNNETRAAKFVDEKLPHIDSVISLSTDLLEEYRSFKEEEMVRLVLLFLRCEEVLRTNSLNVKSLSYKQTIDAYVDVLSQLTFHYTSFQKIYHSEYLKELYYEQYIYPRKFLQLLNDFLNGQLLHIEEDERERHRDWLRKFGDFIPKQLILPGEYNQPSVVQVISEGLDEIQSPSADKNEARLLSLMADK